MSWQFWRPKHTVESVAARLVGGLRDGSIVLDEPLFDEPFDDDLDADSLELQFDLPDGASDAVILDMVKQCATAADQKDRAGGGKGLRIGKVVVAFPQVKIALRSREERHQAGAS